jgi:hypothetical protein
MEGVNGYRLADNVGRPKVDESKVAILTYEYIPTDVELQGKTLYTRKQKAVNLPNYKDDITYIVNPHIIEHLRFHKVIRPDCITYKEGEYIGHSKLVEV